MDAYAYSDGGFRLERLANGWLVGRFAVLEAAGVAHLVTTRQGPDVQQIRHHPEEAGRQITPSLNVQEIAFLEQVHGGDVLVCEQGGSAGFADGLVTATPGLALMGKSADCPLILIADRRGHAVGFAHASWRATVAGIVPAVVRRMSALGCDPSDLVACICPSVGPCCYEVGEEVRTAALQGIGLHAAAFFHLGGWQPHRLPIAAYRTRAAAPDRDLACVAAGPHTPCFPGPVERAGGDSARRADAAAQGVALEAAAEGGKIHCDLWRANACALARAGLAAKSIHVAGICTMCRNDLFPSHRREGAAAGRFAAVIGWASPS